MRERGRGVDPFLFVLSLCISLSFLREVESKLILDEDFSNLDYWAKDLAGSTAVVKLVPSTANGTQTMLSTNVSYCGNDSCYRAEITTPPYLRSSIISGTTGL
jgi:hypothetical protein